MLAFCLLLLHSSYSNFVGKIEVSLTNAFKVAICRLTQTVDLPIAWHQDKIIAELLL